MFARPDYTEHIGDKRLEARVWRRYGKKIAGLEAEGFELTSVLDESVDAGIIVFVFVLLVQLFKRDALAVSFPTRLTFYQPLLFHQAAGCYACVSALSILIASYFVDGTVLITSDSSVFEAGNTVKIVPEKNFDYLAVRGSVPELWQQHQQRLARKQAEGCILKLPLNFHDYTLIEYRNLDVQIGIRGERK